MKPDKFFLNCCKSCEGKCCKPGGVYITQKEYEKIDKDSKKGLEKHLFGFRTILNKECIFLNKKGCTLGKNRFLECKLYPFEIRGIKKLVLKKECPYHEVYDNKDFLKQAYELFDKYKKEGIFSKKDVIGILNNSFPDKL